MRGYLGFRALCQPSFEGEFPLFLVYYTSHALMDQIHQYFVGDFCVSVLLVYNIFSLEISLSSVSTRVTSLKSISLSYLF